MSDKWEKLGAYLDERGKTLQARLDRPDVVDDLRKEQELRLAEVQAIVARMAVLDVLEKNK